MNEQYEKSLSKLELDKVLSLLADHASSQAAKDRCMAIRPSADADEIRHLLEETSAACKCITIKGSPSFGGLYDVGASLDRAYRGGCLSPEELLRIAGVLRAARQAKSYAEGEGAQEASVLDLYFQQIRNFQQVKNFSAFQSVNPLTPKTQVVLNPILLTPPHQPC